MVALCDLFLSTFPLSCFLHPFISIDFLILQKTKINISDLFLFSLMVTMGNCFSINWAPESLQNLFLFSSYPRPKNWSKSIQSNSFLSSSLLPIELKNSFRPFSNLYNNLISSTHIINHHRSSSPSSQNLIRFSCTRSLLTCSYTCYAVMNDWETTPMSSPVICEILLSGFTINSSLRRRTHLVQSFSVVFLHWFYVFSWTKSTNLLPK